MSFLRKHKIKCGKPGGKGFETSELRIAFSISRSEDKSGNSATLSIWNLNPEHEAMVCEKDCYIEIQAGYEDTPLMTIFTGYVTYGEPGESEGADRSANLELVDGRVEVRDTYVSKSYSGSTGSQKIIDDIGREMGLSVSYADDVTHKDIPNGYSFVGQGTSSLDKACAASGLQWYIDNGVLHIKKKNGTMSKQVYELSADTGLIGFPKRVTQSGDSEEDKNVIGYEVQYFLNADIKVSDYVYLNSKKHKGYCRVQSLKIDGDSHSGDWMCSATLMME
jgi:hypothetical protein